MRKIIFFIIVLFSFFNGFGSEINNYEHILIKTIPIGKEGGDIGYLKKIVSGMPRGPLTFVISKTNNIYIPDFANCRINIYDLNLNYQSSFKEKEHDIIRHTSKILIDDDDNLIAIGAGLGLKKMDQKGETLIFIDIKLLPSNINIYKCFIINSNIIYYDDNELIKCIKSDGKIMNSEETLNILEAIEQNETDNIMQSNKGDKNRVIEDIKNQKKYIIIADKYYNSDFYKTKEFFEKTKEYYEEKKVILTNKKSNQNLNKIEIADKILLGSTFLGYDAEHNSYWRNYDDSPKKRKEFVFIYSNYGEVIDAFYFEDLKDKSLLLGKSIKIAIAPSGDVYFMRNDETGSYFWKVERRW